LAGFGYSILMTNFIIFLAPLVLITAITGLEVAIGAIQSYVFAILSCAYIKDSIYLH
jgi:F-type H+-transporting ATPase subunit a